MSTITRETTIAAERMLESAKSGKYGEFVTGAPIAVMSYYRDENDKVTLVTFRTERGVEDLCRAASVADAKADAKTKVVITGKTEL